MKGDGSGSERFDLAQDLERLRRGALRIGHDAVDRLEAEDVRVVLLRSG